MIQKAMINDRISVLLRDELLFDNKVDFSATIDEIGIDSIQLMQLFVYLEETFDFEFTEDAAPVRIQDLTLQALVDHVHTILSSAQSSAS